MFGLKGQRNSRPVSTYAELEEAVGRIVVPLFSTHVRRLSRADREAIIRLNERFDALGEKINLKDRIDELEKQIAVLNAKVLGADNAKIPDDLDVSDYLKMGLDKNGNRK